MSAPINRQAMAISPVSSLIEIGRLIRFSIVGITAASVYTVVSLIAVEILHLDPLLSSIIGQIASTGISYFGHSMFSFAVKTDHRTYLKRFLTIMAAAFALNIGISWLLTELLRVLPRFSIAVVTVLIPLMNYVLNRFWVFKPGLEDNQKAAGN
jgi:putative flippase GtrA